MPNLRELFMFIDRLEIHPTTIRRMAEWYWFPTDL